MHDLIRVTDESAISSAYQAELEALGIEGEYAALGPCDKVMKEKRAALIELAQRAARHELFIDRYYRKSINRLIQNFLDPAGMAHSIYLSYEYFTQLQIQLSCDTIKQVKPVIRLLIAEGLKLVGAPRKDSDSVSKTWEFVPRFCNEEIPQPRLELVVTAKRCERVQTGTREVPVYKTVCSWGEDQADLPPTES